MRRGREAAWTAALNGVAVAREHLGSLDKVTQVIRLGVSIATSGDGAICRKADAPPTCCKTFSEKKNSCLVYGVACFPPGTPVEIEVIFEVLSTQRIRRR